MTINREKYITFKRDELYELFGELALPPYTIQSPGGNERQVGKDMDCAPVAAKIDDRIRALEIHDAVVIRKKDRLAVGVLEVYASSAWAQAATLHEIMTNEATNLWHRPALRAQLLKQCQDLRDIADYFHGEANDTHGMEKQLPTP